MDILNDDVVVVVVDDDDDDVCVCCVRDICVCRMEFGMVGSVCVGVRCCVWGLSVLYCLVCVECVVAGFELIVYLMLCWCLPVGLLVALGVVVWCLWLHSVTVM